MFCRTSTLRHPGSEVTLTTPLLIPSFSSKGFATGPTGKGNDVGQIFGVAREFLEEVCLVSAYDIFYSHLPKPDDMLATTSLLFVDSGGYEISSDCDYSAVTRYDSAPQPWDLPKLESIVSSWPEHVPALFVSYDQPAERRPFAEQIRAARALFRRCSLHLKLFLLKPETTTQQTLDRAIRAAIADPEALARFDVIGVTEKELGTTMLGRMQQIAQLRRALDEADVSSPIHVFGALDPISVCLYYVAGAEIFDGLTWLRYGYRNGVAIYLHNMYLKYGLNLSDAAIRSRTISDNYYALQELQHSLRDFQNTRDFSKLGIHGEFVRNATDSLGTKLSVRRS